MCRVFANAYHLCEEEIHIDLLQWEINLFIIWKKNEVENGWNVCVCVNV